MGLLDRILGRTQDNKKEAAPSPSEIAAFFNEAAKDEEHFPSTIDPRILHVRWILEHLGDVNGKVVADAGSGKGRFAKLVKEANPQSTVVAIDIATAMLQHVPQGVEKAAGSLTALPLATESCHGVYATESLEHAVDIDLAIAEICRITAPGGRIAIIDKNKDHWGRFDTPSWEKWFGQKELESKLKRHCRKVESRPISYWEEETPDGLFLIWTAVK